MQKNRTFDIALLTIGILLAVLLLATSCSHNGYGCHGRGKEITGTGHKFRMR